MENQQVLEEKSIVSLAIYSPPFMGNRKLGVLSVASLGEGLARRPIGKAKASLWAERAIGANKGASAKSDLMSLCPAVRGDWGVYSCH